MKKIAFYGASVTQQRNGYVKYFAKLSKAKVLKFGFGGMHLNDAGIGTNKHYPIPIYMQECFIQDF